MAQWVSQLLAMQASHMGTSSSSATSLPTQLPVNASEIVTEDDSSTWALATIRETLKRLLAPNKSLAQP